MKKYRSSCFVALDRDDHRHSRSALHDVPDGTLVLNRRTAEYIEIKEGE